MSNRTGVASGLLSWLYAKRLKRLVEEQENLDTKKDSMTEIKVHKILAGPYQASDDPDFPEDEEDFFWIEAMVEYDGYYEAMTVTHHDFNKIYASVNHMGKPTVEPYILGSGSGDD
jgi:hypothetical protein